MEISKYDYLLETEAHPTEDSYFLKRVPLPSGVRITITEDNGSKRLTVYPNRYTDEGIIVGDTYAASSHDVYLLIDLSPEIQATFCKKDSNSLQGEVRWT